LGSSRNARGTYGWRWTSDQFAEAAQVLGDGRQGELKLRPAWAPQSEPAQPQNALQVGKQHFDLFAISAGLDKRLRPGDCTRNIASFFVHIAWHFALW
jgi:hypothetical protein